MAHLPGPVFDVTGANALGMMLFDSDDGIDVIWSVLSQRSVWLEPRHPGTMPKERKDLVLYPSWRDQKGARRGKSVLNGINLDAYFGSYWQQ